jgi:hypothetical protein
MGRAKSYAERLVKFVALDPLDEAAAADAIRVLVERENEAITPDALAAIVQDTQGYPIFSRNGASTVGTRLRPRRSRRLT